jgi:hypothetical protein
MWKFLVLSLLVVCACKGKEQTTEIALPEVAPDTVVVSWSVISRAEDRDSIHVALDASRKLHVTNKAPNGTMMSVARTISDGEYAKLIGKLRTLDCCSLRSTTRDRESPSEAKPQLEINFGDVSCEVALWDREWREGLARECGFTVARLHGAGFVPDPPVDGPSP